MRIVLIARSTDESGSHVRHVLQAAETAHAQKVGRRGTQFTERKILAKRCWHDFVVNIAEPWVTRTVRHTDAALSPENVHAWRANIFSRVRLCVCLCCSSSNFRTLRPTNSVGGYVFIISRSRSSIKVMDPSQGQCHMSATINTHAGVWSAFDWVAMMLL